MRPFQMVRARWGARPARAASRSIAGAPPRRAASGEPALAEAPRAEAGEPEPGSPDGATSGRTTMGPVRRSIGALGDAVPRGTIRKATIVAIFLIGLLSGADVLTTRLVLGRSGVEANPLAGALLSSGMLLWAKLIMVVLAGFVALRIRPRLGVLLLAWFVAGVYATAVLSNLLVLRLT